MGCDFFPLTLGKARRMRYVDRFANLRVFFGGKKTFFLLFYCQYDAPIAGGRMPSRSTVDTYENKKYSVFSLLFLPSVFSTLVFLIKRHVHGEVLTMSDWIFWRKTLAKRIRIRRALPRIIPTTKCLFYKPLANLLFHQDHFLNDSSSIFSMSHSKCRARRMFSFNFQILSRTPRPHHIAHNGDLKKHNNQN